MEPLIIAIDLILKRAPTRKGKTWPRSTDERCHVKTLLESRVRM